MKALKVVLLALSISSTSANAYVTNTHVSGATIGKIDVSHLPKVLKFSVNKDAGTYCKAGEYLDFYGNGSTSEVGHMLLSAMQYGQTISIRVIGIDGECRVIRVELE